MEIFTMGFIEQFFVVVCCYQKVEGGLILLALLVALRMRLKHRSKQPLWFLKRGLTRVSH